MAGILYYTMAQSSRLRVNWDQKGKPRATISAQAARILIEHAKLHLAPPNYLISEEAAYPFQPYIKLESGAITERPEKLEEVITSVRLLKETKVAFSMLMANQGLTTCQAVRNFMEQQVSLYRDAAARLKPPKPD